MLNGDQVDEEARGHSEASCRHCGKLIEKEPYISMGDTYCSEHCFLKTRDACACQEDMFNLLAETLVSALDLREHETGLHSKRAAWRRKAGNANTRGVSNAWTMPIRNRIDKPAPTRSVHR